MPNLNIDMKSTADFAVKSAHDRFQTALDYSDDSISRLDNIVTQIYWGFTSRDKDTKDDLVYNTALIWGSYLGEYMRQKWGGTWVRKVSDPIISIKNIEFNPIALIYHKITDHPEYSLESFIQEAGKRIPPRVITPAPVQPAPVAAKQPKVLISSKKLEQPRKIDKRLFIALGGVVGALVLVLVAIFGVRIIKSAGLPAIGSSDRDPTSNALLPIPTSTNTATPYETATPFPTPTLLPTFTPAPTLTHVPSRTPVLTDTPTVFYTPTQPTFTPTRTPLPTRPTRTPTNTHIPATEAPAPTKTPLPGPTDTQPPPPRLTSCQVNPSTIQAGVNTSLTFSAQFNYPGYQFEAIIQGDIPGKNGCVGTDSNGDGSAECSGSSGLVPGGTKVDVKFTSSAGDCGASYGTP